jgi:hypothetical protein
LLFPITPDTTKAVLLNLLCFHLILLSSLSICPKYRPVSRRRFKERKFWLFLKIVNLTVFQPIAMLLMTFAWLILTVIDNFSWRD